eukprot:TRINITY_DN8005_c0_g1_i1.p1 TRINITY_DN8005_c0_g1~~TRINITY_DN8005_c0_g1_i1.p1  ORF type:complete len:441 (+),score=78.70 TRINITY_DN8005_c0_g1_i1:474-1796(+)
MPTFAALFVEPSTTKDPKPKLEKKDKQQQVSPFRAPLPSPNLYKTPRAAPIPHVPSSYNCSPYLLNHKRREIRPSDAQSHFTKPTNPNEVIQDEIRVCARNSSPKDSSIDAETDRRNGNGEARDSSAGIIVSKQNVQAYTDRERSEEAPVSDSESSRDVVNIKDDAFDASASTMERNASFRDLFENGVSEQSAAEEVMCFKFPLDDASVDFDSTTNTSRNEFFDAPEDLSVDDSPVQSFDRLNSRLLSELEALNTRLSSEIEKREKAEKVLSVWQEKWVHMAMKFSAIGLSLPPLETLMESEEDGTGLLNFVDEVEGRLTVAKVVGDAIGRASVRAEMSLQMEELINSKDFEISRLHDKIKYHELVYREMFQRNQEAIELGRRRRQERREMKKWIWCSIGLSFLIGGASLAYKYIPWSETKLWNSLVVREADKSSKTDVA